jgi:hypothetical protein
VIVYNKETDDYEFANLNNNNNLKHVETGNYIINESPFETFLKIVNMAKEMFDIKYLYAHNGSKYDTVLLLSYIMNNNVNIKYETMINNGRLMSLTLHL